MTGVGTCSLPIHVLFCFGQLGQYRLIIHIFSQIGKQCRAVQQCCTDSAEQRLQAMISQCSCGSPRKSSTVLWSSNFDRPRRVGSLGKDIAQTFSALRGGGLEPALRMALYGGMFVKLQI